MSHGARREQPDGGVQAEGPFRGKIVGSAPGLETRLLRLLAREAASDEKVGDFGHRGRVEVVREVASDEEVDVDADVDADAAAAFNSGGQRAADLETDEEGGDGPDDATSDARRTIVCAISSAPALDAAACESVAATAMLCASASVPRDGATAAAYVAAVCAQTFVRRVSDVTASGHASDGHGPRHAVLASLCAAVWCAARDADFREHLFAAGAVHALARVCAADTEHLRASRPDHPAVVKNELAVSALWLLSAHRPAALTLLGLLRPPGEETEPSKRSPAPSANDPEEGADETAFSESFAFEPAEEINYRDMPREEWYPPGSTPPPPPTPPEEPVEVPETAATARAGVDGAAASASPPPRTPPPTPRLLLPVVRVLAGGRARRGAASSSFADEKREAAAACRDRLLELCCLLLRALCGVHPDAPRVVASIAFDTAVTTVTTRKGRHVGATSTVTTTRTVTVTLGDALVDLAEDPGASPALRGAAAALYEEASRRDANRHGEGSATRLLGDRLARVTCALMAADDAALRLQGARCAARASVAPRGKLALAHAGGIQRLIATVRRSNDRRAGDETPEASTLTATLTTLLNLSVNPQLQARICAEGLRPLLRAARRRGSGAAAAARLAQAVLSNVSRHPDNRSRMYRMELRVKEKVVRAEARAAAAYDGHLSTSSSEEEEEEEDGRLDDAASRASWSPSTASARVNQNHPGGGARARAAGKLLSDFQRWMDSVDEEETALGKGACHEQAAQLGARRARVARGALVDEDALKDSAERATLEDLDEEAGRRLRRANRGGCDGLETPSWVDRLSKGKRTHPAARRARSRMEDGGGGDGSSSDEAAAARDARIRTDDDDLDAWGSCFPTDARDAAHRSGLPGRDGGSGGVGWRPAGAKAAGRGPPGGRSLPGFFRDELRAPLSSMWSGAGGSGPAAGAPDEPYDPWSADVLEFKERREEATMKPKKEAPRKLSRRGAPRVAAHGGPDAPHPRAGRGKEAKRDDRAELERMIPVRETAIGGAAGRDVKRAVPDVVLKQPAREKDGRVFTFPSGGKRGVGGAFSSAGGSTPAPKANASEARHERMDIFEHVDGSKVYEGLFPVHEAPDGRKFTLYRWRPELVEEIAPEPMRELPLPDRLVFIRRRALPPTGPALKAGLAAALVWAIPAPCQPPPIGPPRPTRRTPGVTTRGDAAWKCAFDDLAILRDLEDEILAQPHPGDIRAAAA